ncbi:isopentenyl-diphosphate delta isomerase [Musca autumnalis]|uniref:isopentenyl-diphosphate delta isomerase n=1 Tax=Musca autumnalis TaxID=221902 RepID=UPI003CF2AEC1
MITTLVRRVCGPSLWASSRSYVSFAPASETKEHDELQRLALEEQCILVDENDKVIGHTSKADCHRVDPTTKGVKLHRAFSVFLFNTKGEMLVQKRSDHKITFPNTYTNTCCSHPLYEIEVERDELNCFGIRKAAQRRLNYELGIPTNQIRPENFHYLTRIHYANTGDGTWGEHEIDYILFLQKDVDIKPNMNEVSDVRFVKRQNIDEEILKFDAPLTPWFQLILKNHLKVWWDNLHQLKKFEDHKNIYRY